MKTRSHLILALGFLLPFAADRISAQYRYPFQNPDLPLEGRVNNIVSRMTLDEKVALLSQRPGVPRLGILSMMQVDGPQGSVTSKDSSFRRNVQWMSLSGAGNCSVVALATGQPLYVRGRVDNNGIMLFFSNPIAPASVGVPGNNIRLTQAISLIGRFGLRVAVNAKQ
jgi:hypothetical protein